MIYLGRASLAMLLFAFVLPARASWISPFISEIHYDNAGADVGELVAVTGPAGLDLSGWRIILYNGADGLPYRSVSLSGRLGGVGDSWAERYWPIGGIQNGPDAVALLSSADRLIDFVGYEAAVAALGGGAMGAVARMLPVSEDAGTAASSSLQRSGSADSWVWSLSPATPGVLNRGLAGLDVGTVPAMSVWQLWLPGLAGWLLLWGTRRLRPSAAALQPLCCRME